MKGCLLTPIKDQAKHSSVYVVRTKDQTVCRSFSSKEYKTKKPSKSRIMPNDSTCTSYVSLKIVLVLLALDLLTYASKVGHFSLSALDSSLSLCGSFLIFSTFMFILEVLHLSSLKLFFTQIL